jgi:hypothetical protein
MAKVQVSLVQVSTRSGVGDGVPVASSRVIGTPEVITVTGTSQATTLVADATTIDATRLSEYVWRLAVMPQSGDTAVGIGTQFASTPVATSTTGPALPLAATPYEFGVRAVGDKVALIEIA